jgi:periplasmic protein TonB
VLKANRKSAGGHVDLPAWMVLGPVANDGAPGRMPTSAEALPNVVLVWPRATLVPVEAFGRIGAEDRDSLPARPATPGFGSLLLSILMHLVALAGIVLLIAQARPSASEPGGGQTPIDVLLVGFDAQAAMSEGASAREPQPSADPPVAPELPALSELPELPEVTPPDFSGVFASVDFVLPELPATSLILPRDPVAQPRARTTPLQSEKRIRREPEQARPARPAKAVRTAGRTGSGKAGAGEHDASRTAAARSGAGREATPGAAVQAGYKARIIAHLARFKTYPDLAEARGITGRTVIRLTLSNTGRVLASGLAASSGHALLDAASLAAVRRAQPFPPAPPGTPAATNVTVGMRYGIR